MPIGINSSVMKIIGFAAAYFLSGRLGLLLAVPPGYATAIFPASGVALAGLLLYGYRLWPAVWLGSFLINLSLSFDTSSSQTILKSLLVSSGIGSGAAIQALFGAFLIKRFVGFPNALEDGKTIAKFFILGAPIACISSATIGTSTLISAGVMTKTGLLINWLTWWVGDVIGVIIATPLMFIWFAEPAETWRKRKISVALPLLITLMLSIFSYIYASKEEEDRIRAEFNAQAKIMALSIQTDVHIHEDIIRSIASFFRSSGNIDRKMFKIFTEESLSKHKGVQVLSWAPNVPNSERLKYEATARRDGYPSFFIAERDHSGKLVPASKRSAYVP